jgi:hypothetical protein
LKTIIITNTELAEIAERDESHFFDTKEYDVSGKSAQKERSCIRKRRWWRAYHQSSRQEAGDQPTGAMGRYRRHRKAKWAPSGAIRRKASAWVSARAASQGEQEPHPHQKPNEISRRTTPPMLA